MFLSPFLTAAFGVLSCGPGAAFAACTREALLAVADQYLASQEGGQLQAALASSAVTYRENNRMSDIKKGILAQPLKIDHKRTIVDTTDCATFTEVIVTDPKNPYVIGTQIHHNVTTSGSTNSTNSTNSSSSGLQVALVDSIVTTTGDWLFNASKTLSYELQEDWSPILPATRRDARATLRAAADAYLDLWGHPDAPVPWGEPCDRLEGSTYTGNGSPTDSCNVGIPGGTNPPNSDRRYVVDETVGSVSVLCVFQTMRDAPDSHEFRLNGGKLRYVHTMTVMRKLS